MSSANLSISGDASREFSISTDVARLDVAWVVHSVLESYWGLHLAGAQVRAALSESLVFGAYAAGKQIGFVRVVTDYNIFSSVCDVFTEESWRNKGVGSAMMRAAMQHEGVKGTICILAARPEAWSWYENFDFVLVDKRSGIMQRQPQ